MGKYTPPPVTMRDVLEALPRLRAPLAWTVCIRHAGALPGRCYPYVALGLDRGKGWHGEYRRWGRECKADDSLAIFRTLLLAAQDAALWAERISTDDLMKLVTWELDTPTQG